MLEAREVISEHHTLVLGCRVQTWETFGMVARVSPCKAAWERLTRKVVW